MEVLFSSAEFPCTGLEFEAMSAKLIYILLLT